MKKLIIYICLLMPLAFQSCKKEFSPGDNYDFSNSLPPYVALNILTSSVQQGSPANFQFIMRTALQEPVTVTYSVSGAIAQTNQTATIAKEATTVAISIPTTGVVLAPGESTKATVTLQKAVTASGRVLTIGANNVASAQKLVITISKPSAQ